MSGVQTSVATVVAMDELLIEIIFRVPSILLVRIQLVSKRWQSLIYSPYFRRVCLSRPSPPSFILPSSVRGEFFYCRPQEKLLLTFNFKSPSSEILASHNGLILLETGKLRYRVYNLTTGKSRNLPRPPLDYLRYGNFRFYLDYEPTKSPYHRVIRLSSDVEFVHVYESKSRKWTEIESTHPSDPRPQGYCNYLEGSRSWVCCNNKVYWIPVKVYDLKLNLRRRKLIKTFYWYFDLYSRKSGKFPSINADSKCDERLFESRGRVYGVIRCETEKYFDVFLLSEDDSHWSKICSLDWSMWHNSIVSGLDYSWWLADPGWPVSIVMGEESTILIDIYKTILSFSLSGAGSKMIFDLPETKCYRGFCKFMENFDSI